MRQLIFIYIKNYFLFQPINWTRSKDIYSVEPRVPVVWNLRFEYAIIQTNLMFITYMILSNDFYYLHIHMGEFVHTHTYIVLVNARYGELNYMRMYIVDSF